MDTRRIDVGEVTVAVIEAGAGGRPLLLVHGFGGAKEDFADHLDALSDLGYHAVAPDLRGHGESDQPPGEDSYSLELFAADQLSLADTLGWDRFTLLGHSMGGMASQLLALKAPDRLHAFVLMDTCPGPVQGLDLDLVELAIAVARDQGVDLIADILAEADGPLVTPAGRRLLDTRPGYKAMGDGNLRACSSEMYAAIASIMPEQEDRLDRLRTLAVPTLVQVGEQDKPFLEGSRRLAEAIPGARLVVIDDAGHSPQFENPDAWFAALTTFLAETA
jgi:2-succinyl-6-hydroxy-2,4-cyclohexadiene-1-carboxylate synthase